MGTYNLASFVVSNDITITHIEQEIKTLTYLLLCQLSFYNNTVTNGEPLFVIIIQLLHPTISRNATMSRSLCVYLERFANSHCAGEEHRQIRPSILYLTQWNLDTFQVAVELFTLFEIPLNNVRKQRTVKPPVTILIDVVTK